MISLHTPRSIHRLINTSGRKALISHNVLDGRRFRNCSRRWSDHLIVVVKLIIVTVKVHDACVLAIAGRIALIFLLTSEPRQ
ncbi:hypothetical protein LK468_17025 [Mycobacteroides abscessus]|uniref:hypothetical protein n=1 Tax=Mycobacteroides abscessus TaxID=36809 RepID=UPI0005E36866|nr:hypothetical protein [Mycobacteroides abscessus]UEA47871.1 hypothetical protein LK451_19200 [Mycobacteroides abscessus subsp. abscessus]UEA52148.1 hypothetical protein LK468_17025 [Mycobacteroides abscessus]CPW81140.1 Uncharacterised protein [Mycobacteroides abscessus]SKE34918.1 Uncharacterised protein [Mycobacteroides abscessus subsp. bolletii]SKG46908.1 Uncharacterised protein [Mycobacteroides abscessus subsp. bolletii]